MPTRRRRRFIRNLAQFDGERGKPGGEVLVRQRRQILGDTRRLVGDFARID